jgi:UDP-glucose 4-epimerase
MKIYVTGASGFIGSALVETFSSAGKDVIAIGRRPCPALTGDDMRQVMTSRLFEADWYDPEFPEARIVHCAGLADPRMRFASLNDIHDAEIRPHVSMIETLVSRGWRGRLIFLSSGGTVYGDVDRLPITEDTVPKPKTAYGLYKLHLEHDFAYLARSGAFEAMLLRVSNPYGGFVRKSGQGVIPILIDALRAGRTFEMFGDGSAQRDYIAMKDLVDAISAAMTVDMAEPSLTLNIGSGHGVSLSRLIALVQSLSGRRLDVIRSPAGANVQDNVLCCELAKKHLAWSARVTFEDGLLKLLQDGGTFNPD